MDSDMIRRPFAYSTVFRHPPLEGPAFFGRYGQIRPEIPLDIARVCKNESNCTVFLPDGTWFTTWGQGQAEAHVDQRLVFATSTDAGRTWSAPAEIRSREPKPDDRAAYGIPFVVPTTGRIYFFYFQGTDHLTPVELRYLFSDDRGATWSASRTVPLPQRDISLVTGKFKGWVNHPPQIMPTGEVILTFGAAISMGAARRNWQLGVAEVFVLRCDNILTETDATKLAFTLLPDGPRGIRVDGIKHVQNPALLRLMTYFGGFADECAWNFQEMTVVPLADGRWLGVGRCSLGSPGYTISADRGHTWTKAEPLCYGPGGAPIHHPMTMCPIAKTTDGRIVLLFTNNDGADRGAQHVWDGWGRTRNPQWIVAAREIPGETRNAGLQFGRPRIIARVDDHGDTNLKTGVSMPQFFERDGRYFVCYNINKEHILLDELTPADLDSISP